ncbi:hypothetical protein [Candidatus Albibeggiatoa sp. nov. BB20]|uniref:hypothetical protein n=1 Tax=Candidatus Albibeggiatoa sp. nov. BB20 TaxID=3162723 RepID=UPI0033653E94
MMTNIQIESNDLHIIQQFLEVGREKFHLKIHVINDVNNIPQTKWAEFAEKMDGLFTPEIVEHIEESRKEVRG